LCRRALCSNGDDERKNSGKSLHVIVPSKPGRVRQNETGKSIHRLAIVRRRQERY
jgi:hypothetical protein